MGISCDGVSKVMGYPSLTPDALEMATGKVVLPDLSINSSDVFRTHKQEFMDVCKQRYIVSILVFMFMLVRQAPPDC